MSFPISQIRQARIGRACAVAASVVVLAAAGASADTFTENFTGGSNVGGWSYLGTDPDGNGGPDFNILQTTGGNPGAFIQTPDGYATFAPTARTHPTNGGIFVGDWKARNVTSIGIDMMTIAWAFNASERPISLRIMNDAGTPFDEFDDWGFWFVGPQFNPEPGEGWRTFDFAIDSQATANPANWLAFRIDGESGAGLQWSTLMLDVDRVEFYHGEPDFFYILNDYVLGLDNARITEIPQSNCPADVDGSDQVDVLDLLAVINAWGACASCPKSPCAADVAPETADCAINVLDLLAVINGWGPCE